MFHHSPQADMSTLASRAAQSALPRRGSMVAKLQAKAALPRLASLPSLPTSIPVAPPVITTVPATTPATAAWMNAASKIVVIGAGGAGCNAVNRMVDQPTANFEGIRFAVANTDAQALTDITCENKLTLGPKVTRGLGAGGRAEIGTRAAEESTKAIEELIGDADLVFITLGLGGGTGSGAAPIIARIAREKGAVVVAIATMPFGFEGNKRAVAATAALEHLRAHSDTIVVVNNDALLSLFAKDPKKLTLPLAFSIADQCLQQAVDGMVGIIRHPGYINLDFADVRATLLEGGRGYFGTGIADGDHAASKAMTKALNSHLLGKTGMAGAKKVLVYFKGDPAMEMDDIKAAMELLNDYLDPDAHTIFGYGPDTELGEQVEVTLFAVGMNATPTPPVVTKAAAPKVEKPETKDAAVAILPFVPLDTSPPSKPAFNGKGSDCSLSTQPSTPALSQPTEKPQNVAIRKPRHQLTGGTVRKENELPAFMLRDRYGVTEAGIPAPAEQPRNPSPDDLDVPAFIRRANR
jgi:cell division protein FtsZ